MTISSITGGGSLCNFGVVKPQAYGKAANTANVSSTLQQAATSFRTKQANSAAAENRQHASSVYMLERNAAIGLMGAAEQSLSETEAALARMKELAEMASDPMLNEQDRYAVKQEMEKLLEKLNEISDGSGAGVLDGSFGGVAGKDGISAMGIDKIESDGRIAGKAKFYLTNNGGKISISVRINGETVTNTLNADDQETTFKFADDSKITLRFGKGAGNLKSGVITNVGFDTGKRSAEVKEAISADKSRKNISIEVEAVDSFRSRVLQAPKFFDTSAIGLNLAGLDISSMTGALKAVKAINSAMNKVANLHNDVRRTTEMIHKRQGKITELASNADATALLSQATSSMKSNAADAILAQAASIPRQEAIGLLAG